MGTLVVPPTVNDPVVFVSVIPRPPEFALLNEPGREELADAVGAALSLDAWIVLRRRDGMSFERATAVWRRTLTALLAYGSVVPAAE